MSDRSRKQKVNLNTVWGGGSPAYVGLWNPGPHFSPPEQSPLLLSMWTQRYTQEISDFVGSPDPSLFFLVSSVTCRLTFCFGYFLSLSFFNFSVWFIRFLFTLVNSVYFGPWLLASLFMNRGIWGVGSGGESRDESWSSPHPPQKEGRDWWWLTEDRCDRTRGPAQLHASPMPPCASFLLVGFVSSAVADIISFHSLDPLSLLWGLQGAEKNYL